MSGRQNSSISTMIWVVAAVLCALPATAVDIVDGPTLTMDPNGLTPLAGVVELQTAAPELASLRISGDGDSRLVDFPVASQLHALPVLGMKPGLTYTVEVIFDGVVEGVMMATTPSLPADFPTLEVTVSAPAAMEPGFTLLDCFARASGDPRARYTIIVDDEGDVVWYSTLCASDLEILPNGNLFRFSNPSGEPNGLREYTMLGDLVKNVLVEDPGTRLHHDMIETPMGTYVSLTRYEVSVDDFPTSETDPAAPAATTAVRDEPVVEFLPDGSLRDWWLLTEIIDPTRIGYDSLRSSSEGVDWAHDNAVTYDPSDDSFIVSARHQDAVFKFSRSTGELIWILGPHANWSAPYQPFLLTPVGTPFRWQYHQHAPMITGDGTLLLFDNGNRRASPFDGQTPLDDSENFSRAVEYLIDEDAMTVQQVWEFGEHVADPLFSNRICDADWLPTTGNVLTTFGAVSFVGGDSSASLGRGENHARIIETTDDAVPVPVFDLAVYDDSDPAARITIFRSERVPSLYPTEYLDAPNGVGDTLRAAKDDGTAVLSWTPSPVDAAHDAPAYYVVYRSTAASAGFEMMDTTLTPDIDATGTAEFYKVVAVNRGGSSGDEPAQ